jgi:hypothetical protein
MPILIIVANAYSSLSVVVLLSLDPVDVTPDVLEVFRHQFQRAHAVRVAERAHLPVNVINSLSSSLTDMRDVTIISNFILKFIR